MIVNGKQIKPALERYLVSRMQGSQFRMSGLVNEAQAVSARLDYETAQRIADRLIQRHRKRGQIKGTGARHMWKWVK